ncbi:MAG TPA: pyridoxal phosphate-dependent aminotransferase family protein [Verrucomicrobiae bacterium]
MSDELQQVDRTYVCWKGKKLIYFAGCDYFRLASHPKVLRAVKEGVSKYGVNVAASRRTTGNHALYGKLEGALAKFFGVKEAVLTSNGYLTNLAVAQGLEGEVQRVFLDELAHASLKDAAQLMGVPITVFAHRSPGSLLTKWRDAGSPQRCLVMTDGMFAHDGSLAPLKDYLTILPEESVVLVDDAHAAGVLGTKGRGSVEHCKVSRNRVIQTVTLSKAFGVYGGAILAPAKWHELILTKSRLLVGNTPMPLPLVNGCLAAIAERARDAGLRKRLFANIRWLRKALHLAGVALSENESPIFPVMPKSEAEAEILRKKLLEEGIYPPFIHYPGGPKNGYFRFAISSEHTPAQLQKLVKALIPV